MRRRKHDHTIPPTGTGPARREPVPMRGGEDWR